MGNKFQELLEGEQINNWTVIGKCGIKNRVKHYSVICKCGSISIKNKCQIRKNKECYLCCRKSQTEKGGPRRTHGACSGNSDLYKTYQARHYMIRRCEGKTVKDYINYKCRGITVCPEWLQSFENFLKDMGKRPENTSLERIDNDKGYFPENCRWATTKEQNDNKRGCIHYTHNGERNTIARWAEKWGVTRSKAHEWIKRQGVKWVVENLESIKQCKTGMTNQEYLALGLGKRKGSGQRKHSASRDRNHPLHKMYKTWDYMKNHEIGMCSEWDDFMNFVTDMGTKPEDKKLKRLLITAPFSKENCFWG